MKTLNLEFAVLLPADLEAILEFERARLRQRVSDPVERELSEWSALWRREALGHFLALGWSFAARASGTQELRGYFLAQPLLFFCGMTQTLFVEHLAYTDPQVGEALVDLAVRWGRDKHMQKVNFAADSALADVLAQLKASPVTDRRLEIASTRIRT